MPIDPIEIILLPPAAKPEVFGVSPVATVGSGRLLQAVREREILRCAGALAGKDSRGTADQARREVLIWAENRTGGLLPQAAWNYEDFHYFAGGRNCSAVRIVDENRDIWAIRADNPDKNVPQRVWTVEAAVGYQPKSPPLFSPRLLVSSPEAELRIEPAVPGLALQVATACGLYRGVEGLTAEPWIVESNDDAEARLLWLLNGDNLVALSENAASIQRRTGARQSHRRKPTEPGQVLAWEVGS